MAAALIFTVLVACMLLNGCSRLTSENGDSKTTSTDTGSENLPSEDESPVAERVNQPSETESRPQESESTVGEVVPLVQQKIVLATDLHYLAEKLSGNRGQSFMLTVESGDGSVLQYGPEILDAFIDDMIKERPDLIILSGDLTLNGERKSHVELAQKLERLLLEDIPVIVLPGNHDINNPEAARFTSDGIEKEPSVTAEEFADIYADYGYGEAYDRDQNSLSYIYELDDYYRIMMLDTCQYDPVSLIGGMIKRETYDWIDEQLEYAWEEGAQFITVSHHNLLDQSGVSRDFYDNCTIEHNEELLQRLSDGQVRLHLSGHLHLQHHMQDPDTEICEIVTGSLIMTPCHYGVLKIMDTGDLIYDAQPVDVNGWAKRHSYRNKDLADFTAFGEQFLRRITYQNALLDLRRHTIERRLLLSDERIEEMARFYAKLCVNYYSGRMFEIVGEVKAENAFRYWNEVGYVSDLSDFLMNILNDDAKDFSHLEIPY